MENLLHPHKELVYLSRVAGLQLSNLTLDAQQALNVVAELMGNDIGLREIPRRAEPAV